MHRGTILGQGNGWLALAIIVLFLACSAACSKDPEAVSREHTQRGDALMTEKKFDEAVVEYRVALQAAPQSGKTHEKLAEAYAATGEPARAVASMLRAADLLPTNSQVQIKAATGLLMARRYADGATRAKAALAADPDNATALLVLANAQAGQRNFEEALAANRRAMALAPERADIVINLAALQYARGMSAEAEASYRRAVALDPKSVSAAIGLADFLSLSDRMAEADAMYQHALALDPASVEANRAVAIYHIDSGRLSAAEPHLKQVALGSHTPEALYDLVELYLAAGRREDAAKLLNALRSRKVQYVRATVKLASLASADGYTSQGLDLVKTVLDKNPKDANALAVKSLIVLQNGDSSQALTIAVAAVAADERSEAAQFALGKTSIARGQVVEAKRAFAEALKLNPKSLDALLELAELHLAGRQLNTAIDYANQAAKISPHSVRVQLMQARILSEDSDNFSKAQAIFAKLGRDYPNAPEVHLQNGRLARAKRDMTGAAKSFTRVLELDPGSTEALIELIKVDLDRNDGASARRRIDAALAKRPDSPNLLLIAGKAYTAIDVGVAEKHLRRAIELDPSNINAYETLAILYVTQRKLDSAREQFVTLTTQQPKSPYPPTMVGILTELQGRKLEAEEWYQRAIGIDSRTAAAANNLAWLWAQRGHQLDQAYLLAQTAQRELPNEAQISDTVGFIALKKRLIPTALKNFQDSIALQPQNPDFHYHMGLALIENGEFARARTSLQKALTINPNFSYAADARRAIDKLPY